jgi:hypothetical protein
MNAFNAGAGSGSGLGNSTPGAATSSHVGGMSSLKASPRTGLDVITENEAAEMARDNLNRSVNHNGIRLGQSPSMMNSSLSGGGHGGAVQYAPPIAGAPSSYIPKAP